MRESETQSQRTALVAMPCKHRRSSLLVHLSEVKLEAHPVETCREAHDFLRSRREVDLVITDVSLSDGNWCDIVKYVVQHSERSGIIVTASVPDERLWSEILWRGVYDLLIEPFNEHEVRRVVEGAMRGAHRPNRQTAGQLKSAYSSGHGVLGEAGDEGNVTPLQQGFRYA